MAKLLRDPHVPDDATWSRVRSREPIIRRLAEHPRIPDAEMVEAMAALGLSRSQVHNLVSRYRGNPVASALLPGRPGRPIGHSKLAPDVDTLIEQVIDQTYLNRQKTSVTDLCRAIAHECTARGLEKPSRKAVQSRLSRRPIAHAVRKREGVKAADDQFRPVVQSYEPKQALQVVQIDHTLVDQIIVDERSREPLGRPWLTLAIDVASRMVTGFYLSLDPPSAISVAMAVRHAVLPKEEWLTGRGIKASWPAAGIPDCLHMDNGKDFHSRALARGCDEYGIERIYRPPATPHYGGHIERLIGTTMAAIHLLPGTTFSNIHQKGDYDSAGTSAMTLAELESWLAIQIVGVYHPAVHRKLGRPPNIEWEAAVAKRSMSIRHPKDPKRFLLDFLPFEDRLVRRDGIHLFHIVYWDPVLSLYIGRKAKMPVKYNPRNLSQVYLQTPDNSHVVVPYANMGRPPITLWEHEHAMSRLRAAGRSAVDEQLIFEAVEAQRALVAGAVQKTLRARRSASRTAAALGSDMIVQPLAIDQAPEATFDNGASKDRYLPYKLEDW